MAATEPGFIDTDRRRWLLGATALPLAPLLGGCATPLPLNHPVREDAEAARRLLACAQVHGLDAYRNLRDVSVAYDGQWRPLIDRVQPEVVDKGFRGPSEERLLPAQGVVAQAYTGPAGQKQVWWQRGSRAGTDGRVEVWTNGQRRSEAGYLAASALVAEAYGLFLLGPLWLVGRSLPAAMAGTERVHGRLCDVVEVETSPGLGLVARDRVAVCIDRDDGICRRVRFTLEGYPGTRGAVAETQSPAMDIQSASNFERLFFEATDRDGPGTATAFSGFAAGRDIVTPPAALAALDPHATSNATSACRSTASRSATTCLICASSAAMTAFAASSVVRSGSTHKPALLRRMTSLLRPRNVRADVYSVGTA
jgi:hypothetical protein